MARFSRKNRGIGPLSDPRDAAEAAGLVYAGPEGAGYSRRRAGRGFAYWAPNGARVTDPEILGRFRALPIPPAWTEVWICVDPRGHLQATGRDEKGRRQYLYHARFREVRDSAKFEHVVRFAETLPALRARIARDMARPGLDRRKVLATVVHLLETTLARVGNSAYARQNRSYGLTTLRTRHVEVEGAELRFRFKGKSGRLWSLSLRDRRVARIVRDCQDLPGQHLFQYLDADGEPQAVSSADVNAYLKDATGAEITAKDFRTWAGAVMAANALVEAGPAAGAAETRRAIRAAVAQVAARLGNTVAVCRKCYIHPAILEAYTEGRLALEFREAEGLERDEAAVLAFLRGAISSFEGPLCRAGGES